jgi:hypothetical protein
MVAQPGGDLLAADEGCGEHGVGGAEDGSDEERLDPREAAT